MRILDLLKRIEWMGCTVVGEDDSLSYCPDCGGEKPSHSPKCELKAEIDHLESVASIPGAVVRTIPFVSKLTQPGVFGQPPVIVENFDPKDFEGAK